MKIFMLDAACNTMPYDHSLCEALSKNGHNVNFFASTYVHTDWTQQQSYNYRRHFYNFTNLLYKNRSKGFLRRYFKTIEHIVNMFQFVRIVKSEKPEILDSIKSSGKLEENVEKLLTEIITELKKNFKS